MNTQRKNMRHSRKHYAEVTRQMKAEKAQAAPDKTDEK